MKETGIDDEGLNEFATEYFPHPTYKDQSLVFYNALGSGKLSIGFNPFAMIQLIRDSMKRIKELGVKSYNTKGMLLCANFNTGCTEIRMQLVLLQYGSTRKGMYHLSHGIYFSQNGKYVLS